MPVGDRLTLDRFIAEMERGWPGTIATRQRDPWRDLYNAFVDTIDRTTAHELPPRWPVLGAELGVGKTVSGKVFSALCPRDVGILFTVRLTDQADEIARDINLLAGETIAIADHAKVESRPPRESLQNWPVVVATHASFEMGLDRLATVKPVFEGGWRVKKSRHDLIREARAWKWPHLRDYGDGVRKLIIVDESLDLVNQYGIRLKALENICDAIPRDLRRAFKAEYNVLTFMLDRLTEYQTPDTRERRAVRYSGSTLDISAFYRALADWDIAHLDDAVRVAQILSETRWGFMWRRGTEHVLTVA